jgi:hypothetical protein
MTPDDKNEPRADPEHPGSERHADEHREGGPRYHGADWKRAEEESRPGGEADPDLPRADDPDRVDPGATPGSRSQPSRH